MPDTAPRTKAPNIINDVHMAFPALTFVSLGRDLPRKMTSNGLEKGDFVDKSLFVGKVSAARSFLNCEIQKLGLRPA